MKPQDWILKRQDWVMLVLAIWLFLSPFFLGYSTNTAAWNSHILGVLIAIFAIWALVNPERWEEWINLALGIWLIISPFVLGFRINDAVGFANHLIVGVLIGADALWALAQRPTGAQASR